MINISKSGKDDRRLFDVFVSLSDMVTERMLVEITQKQSFQMFSATIEEALQLRYEHLKGLKGLRVRDMRFLHSHGPVDIGAHGSA